MRNLWVKISYIWFLVMLFLVGLFSGNLNVNAEEVNFTYGKWRANNGSSWTSVNDFGTNVTSITLNGISSRFGWSTKFQAGTTYRVVIDSGFASYTIASEDIGVLSPTSVSCYGSTSTSSWSADSSLIANCDYIGASRVTNSNHVKYIIDITPLSTIIGLQVNIIYDTNDRYTLSSVNVYNSSSITYGESVSGAIDEQTITIQNEFNDLEQTIINNNQTLIDSITENNLVCSTKPINNQLSIGSNNGRFTSSGTIGGNPSYYVSNYIELGSNTTLKVSRTSGLYHCFYNKDYELISCFYGSSNSSNTIAVGDLITIPTNAKYVRFSIQKSNRNDLFVLHTCLNGNQSVNDSINNVNDTLTSDEVDSPSSSLEEMQDMLPTNGTITQLIALPLNLYQKVLNSINGTCQSFDLGNLYGTNLIMPCIDLNNYLGNTLWNTIDIIISGIFVLTIGRKMIKAFEGFTSMKEGDVIND